MVLYLTYYTPPPIRESQIFGLEMSSACVNIHRLKLTTSVQITVLPPQQLVVQTLVWSSPVLPVMLNQRVYRTIVYSVVVSIPGYSPHDGETMWDPTVL
jgi:hypothetical protein